MSSAPSRQWLSPLWRLPGSVCRNRANTFWLRGAYSSRFGSTPHAGTSQVDQTYIWAARSLGATNRQLIWEVLLPAALPHVLAGMRAAIGLCFICVFVAEMAGAYEGIGFRISTSYLIFRTDKMLASLIVLGVLGACTISPSGMPARGCSPGHVSTAPQGQHYDCQERR